MRAVTMTTFFLLCAFPALAALLGADGAPDRVTSRGAWALSDGALKLQSTRHGEGLWFPETAHAVVVDGKVRVSAHLEAGAEGTVFVRSRYGLADLQHISGYAVVVGADLVRLIRLDDGVPTELARARRANVSAGVSGAPDAAGDVDLAVELKADLLKVSGTGFALHAHDGRYHAGRVGVGGSALFKAIEVDMVRATDMPSAEQPAIGDRRLVVIAEDDVARLTPDETRRRVTLRSTTGRTVLLLNAKARGAMTARGVQPLAEGADIPWRALELEGPGAFSTPEEVVLRLEAVSKAHPTIARVEVLGQTWQQRPLVALRISDNVDVREDEPTVLLNGAHHGHELMATLQVLDAIDELLAGYGNDPEITRFVDELDIVCVPLVNPDGTAAFLDVSGLAGRKNGRDVDGDDLVSPWDGVDLNRNYPFRFGSLGEKASRSLETHWFYRGPSAGSEPETQAMMKLADTEHFTASISFHTLSTVVIAPYSIRGTKSPIPNAAVSLAEEVVGALPEQSNGRRFKLVREVYAVDGTDQDWLFHAFGTAAILVEGPLHNVVDRKKRRATVKAQRASWQTVLRRTLEGPVLRGRVVDTAGAPVVAQVGVAEVQLREGERWTSRRRDGAFAFALVTGGNVNVTVRAPGYKDWAGVVNVDDAPVVIALTAE